MTRIHTNTQLREHGWLIETEEIAIQADGLASTVPSVPTGEAGTWEFRFQTDRYVHEETFDPAEHLHHYEELLSYAEHAGKFVAERRAMEAVARYREQHTDDSLLVRILPATDSPSTNGIWGLLESIEDQSMLPGELAIVQIGVVHLAGADEYDDHADVRQDLESRGP